MADRVATKRNTIFWLKIDAFGGEDLFQDGPPEDPPVKPDPRKFLDP
jgi:antitoxin VapB